MDKTFWICTIPAGAGKSFLGYLQAYYQDMVPYKKEEEFPDGNYWDAEIPFYLWNLKYNLPVETLPMPRGGFDISQSQILYKKFCNKCPTDTMVLQHSFPIGIEKQGVKVIHELAVDVEDIETQAFVQNLGRVKGHIKNNEEYYFPDKIIDIKYLSTIFKINKMAFELKPPKTMISYKKFFFDIDQNEIEKFLVSTLPFNEINQERLDPICDMIEIYTKLNEELLNG
jgi:hypothetical protein